MTLLQAFIIFGTALLLTTSRGYAEEQIEVTGTIFCDNEFKFYVNGELIAEDPVPTFPHNAVNVTFTIPAGESVVFAITAIDWANETTGLEYDNRCVGDGGLRAMFSNGVVTNSSWKCWTSMYGPVNWQDCYATDPRNSSAKVLPLCKQPGIPSLEGCYTRKVDVPEDWATLEFDDGGWEYALEWEDDFVGWGLPPTNCTDPTVYISPDTDPDGSPLTCPRQLDWGASRFIWRDDLDLDNTIHCRYVYNAELAGNGQLYLATKLSTVMAVALTALVLLTL